MNKKLKMIIIASLTIFSMPLSSLAMPHADKMHMAGDMEMGSDMIMLHDDEKMGVKLSAHLKDVRKAMAEHNMSMTHHLMVGFKSAEGVQLEDGKVAVKIESPDGTVSEPISMMAMDGEFGADVTLDQKGMYHFLVGTMLKDGEKRTFHIHHEVK